MTEITQKSSKKTQKMISLREFGRRPSDFMDDLPLILTVYNSPKFILNSYTQESSPSPKISVQEETQEDSPPIKRAKHSEQYVPTCDMPGCDEVATEKYEHYNFCQVHYDHILSSL